MATKAKGTVTVDPIKKKYTLYGDIDPTTGKQVQTSGNSMSNPEYVISGGQVIGKNTNYDPNATVAAPAPTPFTGSPGDIAEKEAKAAADAYLASLTPEQKAQNLVEAGMGKSSAYEENLFGESNQPTTIDEAVKKQVEEQKRQQDFLKRQQDLVNQIQTSELNRAGRQSDAGIAGTEAAMATSREGVESSTKPQIMQEFEATSKEIMAEATGRVQLAQQQRSEAMRGLIEAQKNNNTEMAKSFERQIAQAEMDIRKSKTDLANAQVQQTQVDMEYMKTQGAETRANISSFTDLVNEGNEMSVPSISNFANKLGIDFDTAYNYYEGAKNIRDDKKLDVQTKQLELDKLNQDFQDQIAGVASAEAKKINDYIKLSKSGSYTPEQMQAFAVAMDIPNEKNPIYQAKLKADQADAAIKQAEAEGKILDPIKKLEYAKDLYEYNELTGNDAVYISEGGKYEMIQAGTGVRVNVEDDAIGGQCGNFVNDVIKDRVIPDSYADKKALITSQVAAAGMVFIQPAYGEYAQYGHTGIVESVNSDGTVNVVESNKAAPNTIGRRMNVPITEFDGFFAPKGATKIGGTSASINYNMDTPDGQIASKYRKKGEDSGLKGEELKEFVDKRVEDSYKPMTEAQGKAYNAYVMMSNENEFYDGLVEGVDMEDFADAINTITRKATEAGTDITGDLINKYVVDDNIRQAIMSEFRWLEGALREESGAAITPAEYSTKGTAFFPRFGDDDKTLEQKRKARTLSTDGKKAKTGPAGERMMLESSLDADSGKEKTLEELTAEYESLSPEVKAKQAEQDELW